MLTIPFYQIDAFTEHIFRGNPAAVCLLESWLPERVMQSIATENNLSETAFVFPEGDDYRIRWFTPRQEVPLCGHATLATAFVLFEYVGLTKDTLRLNSQSGPLFIRSKLHTA